MGWPQPATPLQTDNSCTAGIINDTIKQRCSKAIDMRFYWVRDRVRQGHFQVHWKKGANNLAGYFTKHHSSKHHRQMRSTYLPTALASPNNPTASKIQCEGVLKCQAPSGLRLFSPLNPTMRHRLTISVCPQTNIRQS
jgi:hypothetical protein